MRATNDAEVISWEHERDAKFADKRNIDAPFLR